MVVQVKIQNWFLLVPVRFIHLYLHTLTVKTLGVHFVLDRPWLQTQAKYCEDHPAGKQTEQVCVCDRMLHNLCKQMR